MNTMPSLEIIKAGLMTSIQDMGRKGLAYYAIPNAGVMDKNAAKIALLLLNKSEDDPLIECTSSAPHIEFLAPTQIAITGADFQWTVNDEAVQINRVIDIQEGDILKGKFARTGLRGYIAINGKLKIEKIYGSYSTYMNAGLGSLQGRLLKKGDVITWEAANDDFSGGITIPIYKGPEYDCLTEHSKFLLVSEPYTIGSDSNRMGARLKGAALDSSLFQLDNSLPILPGFIQLPPGGQPIVVLQDGQSSGGYPRIAYLQEKYLSVFNQIPLGGSYDSK